MEQKVILKTENQCIYFMRDTNLDFYFIIPNNRNVSIVLGIFPSVSEDIIKSLVKVSDKAILIPVVNNQILTSANHLDMASFKYLDNIFSYLVNFAYKMLVSNNVSVNQKILLNNHSAYENFNKEYVARYNGRVELFDLFPKKVEHATISGDEVNASISSKPDFNPVEPPFKQAEVSSNHDMSEVLEPILDGEMVVNSGKVENPKEPGFVSYVLLGVLSAVIFLVFLYMIL